MEFDDIKDCFQEIIEDSDIEDDIVILIEHRNKIYLQSTATKIKIASIIMKYINRDEEIKGYIAECIAELNKQNKLKQLK